MAAQAAALEAKFEAAAAAALEAKAREHEAAILAREGEMDKAYAAHLQEALAAVQAEAEARLSSEVQSPSLSSDPPSLSAPLFRWAVWARRPRRSGTI